MNNQRYSYKQAAGEGECKDGLLKRLQGENLEYGDVTLSLFKAVVVYEG